jgi:uncharacterized protein (TIGR02246 family)
VCEPLCKGSGDMNTQTDDEKTLRQLIADWSAAARQRDFAGVLANHDPTILMFDVPPPFQSEGLEAYRKTWELFFSAMADPPTFDFSDVRLTVGTDLAFATAQGRCLNREDGVVSELHFRLTMCFQKRAGRWVIVHEHHSLPAD